MNARELPSVALASPALTPSNPGLASTLDILDARRARDGLRSLLGAERSAAAEFLVALADFDSRRGWEPLGHESLFAFLRRELGLSKGGAFWRMSAARLVQRHPQVIEPLRDGRLCMSTTAELARVATDANLAEVLPRFFGLTAREAKEVTAELLPRELPPVREVITLLGAVRRPSAAAGPPLPEPSAASPAGQVPEPVRTFEPERSVLERSPVQPAVVHSTPPRAEVEPLTADRRRLHVTVDRRFLAMLDTARDGLSHALPNASAEQVLRAGLEALLEKQARARGQVKRPRQAPETATDAAQPLVEGPRHRRAGPRAAIPAAVRRAVWSRDGGRCSWPLDGGGTCGSTHRLELDHLVPWARGGDDSAANLRLACAHHNALAARLEFGFKYPWGAPR